MKIGVTKHIDSITVEDFVASAYAQKHITSLYKFAGLLEKFFGESDKDVVCLIEKHAMQDFVNYANDVHRETHNEATGIIVGYYLHDAKNPQKKIILGCKFLKARGTSSTVTCEFSYEDSAQHDAFCKENGLYQVVWVHSHPGFGVFYSGVDSATLMKFFREKHQMGIVVDNIKDKYLGFKIVNGKQYEYDFSLFDINESIERGSLICQTFKGKDNVPSTVVTVVNPPIKIGLKTDETSKRLECIEKRVESLENRPVSEPEKSEELGKEEDNNDKPASLTPIYALSGVTTALVLFLIFGGVMLNNKLDNMNSNSTELDSIYSKLESIENIVGSTDSSINSLGVIQLAENNVVSAVVTAKIKQPKEPGFQTGGIVYGNNKETLLAQGLKTPCNMDNNGMELTAQTTIHELESGNVYYYAAYLDKNNLIGEVKSFVADVKTSVADGISASTAKIGIDNKPQAGYVFGVRISLDDDIFSPRTWNVDLGGNNQVATIPNLDPNTTYYYAAYKKNDDGIVFGDVKNFTTKNQ
ncbi:MAG: Mov34/MPN/PAD-1 family protein [Bacteroidales bacterium]|nr:Mov34/MPN/PAD-1 family protein [Bacteroidales bacterium]